MPGVPAKEELAVREGREKLQRVLDPQVSLEAERRLEKRTVEEMAAREQAEKKVVAKEQEIAELKRRLAEKEQPSRYATYAGGTYAAGTLLVTTVTQARAAVAALYARADGVHALDTEVDGMDIKHDSPFCSGDLICFSVYASSHRPDLGANAPRPAFVNAETNEERADDALQVWADVDGAEGEAVLEVFRGYLEDARIRKVWHNYGFDRHIFERAGVRLAGFHGDTMHMARLYDASRASVKFNTDADEGQETARGYSLSSLSRDPAIVGADFARSTPKVSMKDLFSKPKLRKDGKLGNATYLPEMRDIQWDPEARPRWVQYALLDAKATHHLHACLTSLLMTKPIEHPDQQDLSGREAARVSGCTTLYELYERLWLPFGEILTDMEAAGFQIDTEYLREQQAQADRDLMENELIFRRWADKQISGAFFMNSSSTLQLQTLLYGGWENPQRAARLKPEIEELRQKLNQAEDLLAICEEEAQLAEASAQIMDQCERLARLAPAVSGGGAAVQAQLGDDELEQQLKEARACVKEARAALDKKEREVRRKTSVDAKTWGITQPLHKPKVVHKYDFDSRHQSETAGKDHLEEEEEEEEEDHLEEEEEEEDHLEESALDADFVAEAGRYLESYLAANKPLIDVWLSEDQAAKERNLEKKAMEKERRKQFNEMNRARGFLAKAEAAISEAHATGDARKAASAEKRRQSWIEKVGATEAAFAEGEEHRNNVLAAWALAAAAMPPLSAAEAEDRAELMKAFVAAEFEDKPSKVCLRRVTTPSLEPTAFTASGMPQMSTVVLRSLAGSADKPGPLANAFSTRQEGEEACVAVRALVEVSAINTLLENFILPLQGLYGILDAGDRVHGSLNMNTETGRLSSRRPNLQNQPALEKDRYNIRRAFVASPGNTLIVADYGQLELRILAHIAGCEAMKEAFETGGDFHSRTAVNMYTFIQDDIDSGGCLLEKDPSAPPDTPLVKDKYGAERRKAKTLNFSIAYGKTAHGLAKDWDVTIGEAEETVKAWYDSRPEVRDWQERMRQEARRYGAVCTLLGRRRPLPDINSKNSQARGHSERAAINTPIQGSAADIVTLAMVEVARDKRLRELGYTMLLQVHDEIIMEGPLQSADEAQRRLVHIMSHPFRDENGKLVNKLDVELSVDSDKARSWYEAK